MANAVRHYVGLGKLLRAVLVGALGCSMAPLGCIGSGEEGGDQYPDRSLETFRRLDRETIKLGMTESEVIDVLGEPFLPTVVGSWANGEAALLCYDTGRIDYWVHLLDGKVVKAEFFYGYF